MKIAKLKVKNFKCFGPTETVVNFQDLSTLIGANSCGKSAILHALLKIFGQNSYEREISKSDFHIIKGQNEEDITENSLYIEAVLEFPEIESSEMNPILTVPQFFEQMIVEQTGDIPYVRIRLESTWLKGNVPEGIIESKLWFITSPTDEDLADNDTNKHQVEYSFLKANVQMIYVPAVRDPSSQLKNASGTLLWRITHGINWPDGFDADIKSKVTDVDDLFYNQSGVKKIQDVLASQWNSFYKDHRYRKANIRFNSSNLNEILKKMDVDFSPSEVTGTYRMEALGEGLKSLFYLTLVKSLLEIESFAQLESQNADTTQVFKITPPALTILAVEEPENHVSPHLLGRIVENFNEISKQPNAQVIITSHSPSIVKRVEPETINHFRMNFDTHSTLVRKILLPTDSEDSHKYIKEAVKAYPEIYFARIVILGEGDSEEIVIPKILGLYKQSLDSSGITVAPLGGRHVNHFWKLLRDLDIPHITLLDLDRERPGGDWGRIKYAIKQLIANNVNSTELLKMEDGSSLDLEELENMHTYDLQSEKDLKNLDFWIDKLESYNVIFSAPLDLDFMMLTAFSEQYMGLEPLHSANIPNKDINPDEYEALRIKGVRAALKPTGKDGSTYTEEEKDLMVWYDYLFLNRSKPTTHMLAFIDIDKDILENNIPLPLEKLYKKVEAILQDDTLSQSPN